MVDGGHDLPDLLGDREPVVVRKQRARPRNWYQKLPRWVREYAIELGLALAILAAIFLLVEPWDIRVALFGWARRVYSGLSDSLGAAGRAVIDWVRSLTLSDATAVVILLVVSLIALWRVRWRIIHSERYWSTSCPRCGLSELRRVRRHLTGYLLKRVGFPVARYHCSNCAWSGLRIRKRETASPGFLEPPAAEAAFTGESQDTP